ncbi:MAG: hypothetical protein AB1705_16395 [Verrucomicrobiota bacterium]
MKPAKSRKEIVTAVRLMVGITGLLLFNGCTFTRVVNLRYTPIIQTEHLADKTTPQKVVVESFEDGRANAKLAQHRLNPINVHSFKYETRDDIPSLTRSAIVDALLKSGFEVLPLNQPKTGQSLTVMGAVQTFEADTKAGWSKVTLTADVALELTLVPNNGGAVKIHIQGQNVQEQRDFMNVESAAPEAFDRALRECATKFLEHGEFRKLIAK